MALCQFHHKLISFIMVNNNTGKNTQKLIFLCKIFSPPHYFQYTKLKLDQKCTPLLASSCFHKLVLFSPAVASTNLS